MDCIAQKGLDALIQKRKIHVVGLARTGLSVVRFLQKQKISFSVGDDKLQETDAKAYKAQGIRAFSCLEDDHEATLWVISPGIPRHHKAVQAAQARGVSFITDLDLWFAAQNELPAEKRARVAGVTGTNGKSYVVALAEKLLQKTTSCLAAGNIGTPILDTLERLPRIVLLELSSFQLDYSQILPLHVAVLLQIQPDHLDHHGSFDDYALAKSRILEHADSIVLSSQESWPDAIEKLLSGKGFESIMPPRKREKRDYHLQNGVIFQGDKPFFSLKECSFWMDEDIQNTIAAAALAYKLGASLEIIQASLGSFEAPLYRMQPVLEKEGVLWVNNSKATNEAASVAAISGLCGRKSRVFVFLGGVDKGQEFSRLGATFPKNAQAILYGRDGPNIQKFLPKSNVWGFFETLEEGIESLRGHLQRDDALLLAPACSSFDQYQDYRARGAHFNALAEKFYDRSSCVRS